MLRGRVWAGGAAAPVDDAAVVLDEVGRVARIGPAAAVGEVGGLPILGAATAWIGPGVVDAHVHLAFGSPADVVAGGVTSARDLGAPMSAAMQWRTPDRSLSSPHVGVAGPIVTAPGGYPSRSWGRDGFAVFAADAAAAHAVVAQLAGQVDVVKLALEPAGGPVPGVDVAVAVVRAAHEAGLAVTAHALTAATVATALAAGVDELAHMPVEPLGPDLVEAIAAADMLVVSTIQTFVSSGGSAGEAALANARASHGAGVRIAYGSDLGNTGTTPGVDPGELRHLAAIGLGAGGALRAATEVAATAAGVRGGRGRLIVGAPADLVVLTGDPTNEPDRWRHPLAVFVDGRLMAARPIG
ncbi:MAG: amidohydrolase family protein [Actinomycetes bacterium]